MMPTTSSFTMGTDLTTLNSTNVESLATIPSTFRTSSFAKAPSMMLCALA